AANHHLWIGAQIRNDGGGLVGAELCFELCRSQRDQRRQVGHQGADRWLVAPDTLAGGGIAIGERSGMEGERPAVLLGKRLETLHRRAFEALANDLVETKQA